MKPEEIEQTASEFAKTCREIAKSFDEITDALNILFTNNTNKTCRNYQKETYKNIIKHKEESLQIHIKEMDKLRAENKKLRRKNAKLKQVINALKSGDEVNIQHWT